MKRNRGITLIALVITVVIMLILAGVAISAIINADGLFGKVTEAQKEYKKESLLELVEIVKYEIEIDKAITNTKPNITDVIDKVIESGNLTEEDYIISVDEEEQSATIIDKETGVVVDIWIDEEGNIQTEGSVVEDIANVVKPTIEYRIEPEEGTYGEEVKIIVTIKEEKNGIVKVQFPDNSEKTYSNEKIVTEEYVVNENGRYKFTAESVNGRKASKYIEVKNTMSAGDIQLEVTNTNPTNKNVIIQAKYDENIKVGGQVLINADRFQYSIGDNNWQIATKAETTIQVGVNENIYARYYNGTEGFKTISITIQNIDKVTPNAFDLSTSKTTNSITVSGSTTDTGSIGCATANIGIRGYQYKLSSSRGEVLTNWTSETTATSYTFDNLTQGTTYKVSMRAIDKAGNIIEATNKDLDVTTNNLLVNAVKIGDFIKYDPLYGSYNGLWRVFSNIDGKVSIISNDVVENLSLNGSNGYNNGISLLNSIANKYVNINYANSARCVNENDVSNLTSNHLLNINKSYWLATQYYYNDYFGSWDYYLYMKYINSSGKLSNGLLYYTDGGVETGTIVRTLEFGVRPIIGLNSGIMVVSGTGEEDNPWEIQN